MKKSIKLIVGLLVVSQAITNAQVLYTENFDTTTVGSTPAGWSSHANFKVTNTESVSPLNSYHAVDLNGTDWVTSSLLFNNAPGITNASIVNFSFDIKVANYQGLTPGSASNFRVSLLPASAGGPASQFAFGLGYNSMGSLGNTLFFFAGSSSAPTPAAANAIGWDGTNFLSGFNLGALGSGATNGTGGNFYHVSMTYNIGTKAMMIGVTNLSNLSQSAIFNTTWTPGVAFSESNGALIATTGGTSYGNLYLDNVTIIPEPSSLALLLVGLGLLGIYRKRFC